VRLFHKLKTLAKDHRAVVALIVALTAPALIGFAAFAVDVTSWYGTHESLQIAADAGALAAARLGSSDPTALQTVAISAANNATNNQFHFSAKTPGLVVTQSSTSTGQNVTVTSSAVGDKYLSSVIYAGQPMLSAVAVATLHTNYTPPPSATCFSSSSYTYITPSNNGVGSAHVAGIDPVACGDTALIQPLASFTQGRSGTVQDVPIVLNNDGGGLPSAGAANNVPSFTPQCSALYNPADPTTNPAEPYSAVFNGVQTFFGPATMQTAGYQTYGQWRSYYVPPVYNFAPIVVGSGSSFCNLDNICTIPAGAYCGGLQINPGVTINFVSNEGNNYFQILDGNLLMSTSDPLGSSNNPNAPFYFGGHNVGNLILDTQTTIYGGEIQNGTLVFTSSATFNNNTNQSYVDQVCPLGVLPIGVQSNGQPICPTEVTATAGGQTTTTLDTAQTVNGPTTGSSGVIPTNGTYQTTDTYTTTISFSNGIATSWQDGETTTNTSLALPSYGGNLGSSASSNQTTAPFASCTGSSSSLFNSSTSHSSPQLGLSYASGYGGTGSIGLNDSVSVCGKGAPLIANPTGSEIVAANATGTSTIYLSK
jgi:Flp pilus assembly protein TadG